MKQITGEVTVNYKTAEGKEATKVAPVSYPEFENSADVLSFLQGGDSNVKEAVANLNYAFNLKARAAVRSTVLTEIGGPDKAINKAVEDLRKAMLAAGVTMTEDAARVIILKNISDAKAAA